MEDYNLYHRKQNKKKKEDVKMVILKSLMLEQCSNASLTFKRIVQTKQLGDSCLREYLSTNIFFFLLLLRTNSGANVSSYFILISGLFFFQ